MKRLPEMAVHLSAITSTVRYRRSSQNTSSLFYAEGYVVFKLLFLTATALQQKLQEL